MALSPVLPGHLWSTVLYQFSGMLLHLRITRFHHSFPTFL